MIRLAYRISVLIVVLGIAGAMTLRGQTPGTINAANGVAIQGYDAVAYHTQQQAVKGSRAFTHAWRGVTWQFASAANRNRFARSPEQFLPEFGGFCAYGVSRGYAVDKIGRASCRERVEKAVGFEYMKAKAGRIESGTKQT